MCICSHVLVVSLCTLLSQCPVFASSWRTCYIVVCLVRGQLIEACAVGLCLADIITDSDPTSKRYAGSWSDFRLELQDSTCACLCSNNWAHLSYSWTSGHEALQMEHDSKLQNIKQWLSAAHSPLAHVMAGQSQAATTSWSQCSLNTTSTTHSMPKLFAAELHVGCRPNSQSLTTVLSHIKRCH